MLGMKPTPSLYVDPGISNDALRTAIHCREQQIAVYYPLRNDKLRPCARPLARQAVLRLRIFRAELLRRRMEGR